MGLLCAYTSTAPINSHVIQLRTVG